MQLLNRQLGITNFAPLKPMLLDLHNGRHSYIRAFSLSLVISFAVESAWSASASLNVKGPLALVYSFSQLEEKLKAGYRATTNGKFMEVVRLFLSILHTIPLIVVESRREVDEVKELIIIVEEYVLGLQMELERREMKDNPVRQQLAEFSDPIPEDFDEAVVNSMMSSFQPGATGAGGFLGFIILLSKLFTK